MSINAMNIGETLEIFSYLVMNVIGKICSDLITSNVRKGNIN